MFSAASPRAHRIGLSTNECSSRAKCATSASNAARMSGHAVRRAIAVGGHRHRRDLDAAALQPHRVRLAVGESLAHAIDETLTSAAGVIDVDDARGEEHRRVASGVAFGRASCFGALRAPRRGALDGCRIATRTRRSRGRRRAARAASSHRGTAMRSFARTSIHGTPSSASAIAFSAETA